MRYFSLRLLGVFVMCGMQPVVASQSPPPKKTKESFFLRVAYFFACGKDKYEKRRLKKLDKKIAAYSTRNPLGYGFDDDFGELVDERDTLQKVVDKREKKEKQYV